MSESNFTQAMIRLEFIRMYYRTSRDIPRNHRNQCLLASVFYFNKKKSVGGSYNNQLKPDLLFLQRLYLALNMINIHRLSNIESFSRFSCPREIFMKSCSVTDLELLYFFVESIFDLGLFKDGFVSVCEAAKDDPREVCKMMISIIKKERPENPLILYHKHILEAKKDCFGRPLNQLFLNILHTDVKTIREMNVTAQALKVFTESQNFERQCLRDPIFNLKKVLNQEITDFVEYVFKTPNVWKVKNNRDLRDDLTKVLEHLILQTSELKDNKFAKHADNLRQTLTLVFLFEKYFKKEILEKNKRIFNFSWIPKGFKKKHIQKSRMVSLFC